MAELGTPQRIAGVVLFLLVFVLLLKDRWAWLPLGRAVSALLGASLFVAAGVLSADEATAAVNVPTLGLLTGCMILSAHMEKQGLYDILSRVLSSKGTPLGFLVRVSVVAGVSSALLTNDSTCVVLTPLVLRACLQRRLRPTPFLIAIATASNIGSACSPIGNPQNMIIALLGRVYFSSFLGSILVASVGGLALNTFLIARVYARDLAPDAKAEPTPAQLKAAGMLPLAPLAGAEEAVAAAPPAAGDGAAVVLDVHSGEAGGAREKEREGRTLLADDGGAAAGGADMRALTVPSPAAAASADVGSVDWAGASATSAGAAPASSAAASAAAPSSSAEAPSSSSSSSSGPEWTPVAPWRRKVILALLALLPVVFIAADRWIGLTWISLLGAAVLCVVDGGRPEQLLSRVDGTLLLFFSGLFVAVAGFNATGIPALVWGSVADSVSMRSFGGVALFSLIVVVGSNTVSNVPLTLLLAPSLSALPADAALAWLLLAWISTVAGNLTLLGSVANLIVAERAKDVSPMTFVEYLKVGTPSTLLLLVVGTPIVWACAAAITA